VTQDGRCSGRDSSVSVENHREDCLAFSFPVSNGNRITASQLQRHVAQLQRHVAQLQRHVAQLHRHVAQLQRHVAQLQRHVDKFVLNCFRCRRQRRDWELGRFGPTEVSKEPDYIQPRPTRRAGKGVREEPLPLRQYQGAPGIEN
jgi:hypothetical protein